MFRVWGLFGIVAFVLLGEDFVVPFLFRCFGIWDVFFFEIFVW